MAHAWSTPAYGLDGMLVNPATNYGAIGGFLALLSPGAFIAGLDLQDSFLHLAVASLAVSALPGSWPPGVGPLADPTFCLFPDRTRRRWSPELM